MLSKKERKYIDLLLLSIPEKIDEFEIKKLLFKLKDKLLVKNIVVIYFCNNFKNFKTLNKYINFINKVDIPYININGDDLINNGFKNKKNYGLLLEQADNIFINSNFKMKKEKIIKKLLKINA